jgi:hypothetical protein
MPTTELKHVIDCPCAPAFLSLSLSLSLSISPHTHIHTHTHTTHQCYLRVPGRSVSTPPVDSFGATRTHTDGDASYRTESTGNV